MTAKEWVYFLITFIFLSMSLGSASEISESCDGGGNDHSQVIIMIIMNADEADKY